MLIHPEFDPVAIRLGPLAIHWYGLSYLAAFVLFVLLGRLRLRQMPYARLVNKASGAPAMSKTCCSQAFWA